MTIIDANLNWMRLEHRWAGMKIKLLKPTSSLEEKAISHHKKSSRMQNIFRKLKLQICLNNDRLVKCLQKFVDDAMEYKQHWWYQQSIGGLNEHHRRKRFTSKITDMDITTSRSLRVASSSVPRTISIRWIHGAIDQWIPKQMVRGSKEFQQHWLIKHGRKLPLTSIFEKFKIDKVKQSFWLCITAMMPK